MKAGERTLQQILHTADQYSIPLFQRYYMWSKANWEQLWEDVAGIAQAPAEESRRHFLGSIVCIAEGHTPGVTPAYQVIDGQQRLMTVSILLCAMRDLALDGTWTELAAEIEENYLIHRFKKGRERYKVFPRQRDRDTFLGLVDRKANEGDDRVLEAYRYFRQQLASVEKPSTEATLRTLSQAVATRIDFVLINLGNENPYAIFRSLNSTGVDLAQSDLIRNHVFMAMPIDEQDGFDDTHWRPLEDLFSAGGSLNSAQFAAFLRDVLMMGGTYVSEDAAFETLERRYPVGTLQPAGLVALLRKYAEYHFTIRNPNRYSHPGVARALQMVADLTVSTCYPLLLTLLDRREEQQLSDIDLELAVRAISSFVLRRFICGETSRGYARMFCTASKELGDDPVANLAAYFARVGWPDDQAFITRLQDFALYSSRYSRAVLEGLELAQQSASEPVGLDGCSIEHVMPQSIGDDASGTAWKAMLGEDWQQVHTTLIHTIGNLTLVGHDYNMSMQNSPFATKRPLLTASKVYLNTYFAHLELSQWDAATIQTRGRVLAARAASIWSQPKAVIVEESSSDLLTLEMRQQLIRRVLTRIPISPGQKAVYRVLLSAPEGWLDTEALAFAIGRKTSELSALLGGLGWRIKGTPGVPNGLVLGLLFEERRILGRYGFTLRSETREILETLPYIIKEGDHAAS